MPRITLRAARVNAGYTQKEAALLLHVGNKTLSSWENGTTFPNVEKIRTICEVYGVTYNDIIFLPSNPL